MKSVRVANEREFAAEVRAVEFQDGGVAAECDDRSFSVIQAPYRSAAAGDFAFVIEIDSAMVGDAFSGDRVEAQRICVQPPRDKTFVAGLFDEQIPVDARGGGMFQQGVHD